MINSRDIDDLTPGARAWFQRFRAHAEAAGLVYLRHWIVTSFYRDQEYQDWLYAQGRTRPGPKVTWTRHSRHTERRAWDVAIKNPKTGKIDWSVVKADVDLDSLPDYEELAEVGRSMGLTVGMDFTNPDPCHFETPSTVG
jgi:peptidoglycan LD-endopeptidase CwlK